MKKDTSYTIRRAQRFPVILIGEGLLVGAVGGLVVLLYRLALTFAGEALMEPMISGSGIPQVEGDILGKISENWKRVLPAKFLGGFLCILGGLSLGREGPSIQLGAMTGQGISRFLDRDRTEEKYLMTCGASAGLAAAFHAPLAGMMFSLEEIHKGFPHILSALIRSSSSGWSMPFPRIITGCC